MSGCLHTQIICTKICIKLLLQDKEWQWWQNCNFAISCKFLLRLGKSTHMSKYQWYRRFKVFQGYKGYQAYQGNQWYERYQGHQESGIASILGLTSLSWINRITRLSGILLKLLNLLNIKTSILLNPFQIFKTSNPSKVS